MSRPGVVTTISNAYYARIHTRVMQASKKSIHELFHGDSEPTHIWLAADGKSLMSKMPSEPYEKSIVPYSAAMQKISESRNSGVSGNRWKLIAKFVELGLDNDAAIAIATQVYDKIPAHIVVSDETAAALCEHHTNGGATLLTFVIGDKGELVARRAAK